MLSYSNSKFKRSKVISNNRLLLTYTHSICILFKTFKIKDNTCILEEWLLKEQPELLGF